MPLAFLRYQCTVKNNQNFQMPPTNVSREQRQAWDWAYTAPILYEGSLWFPHDRGTLLTPSYMHENGTDMATADYLFPWFHLFTIQKKRKDQYRKDWLHPEDQLWELDTTTNKWVINQEVARRKKRPYNSFTLE